MPLVSGCTGCILHSLWCQKRFWTLSTSGPARARQHTSIHVLVELGGDLLWPVSRSLGIDDPGQACGEDSDCINRLTQVECLESECRCRHHCQNQRSVICACVSEMSKVALTCACATRPHQISAAAVRSCRDRQDGKERVRSTGWCFSNNVSLPKRSAHGKEG